MLDVPSSIAVTKTADPTSLPEPGGDVDYTVVVRNTSAVDDVTINSVIDDPVYADSVTELKEELHRLQTEAGDQRYVKDAE